jgi:hypothetical protein
MHRGGAPGLDGEASGDLKRRRLAELRRAPSVVLQTLGEREVQGLGGLQKIKHDSMALLELL